MWYVNLSLFFTKVNSPPSFILTMWYVNITIVIAAIAALVAGFILTMWYVNKAVRTERISKLSSFILTMWYVNIYKWYDKLVSTIVLY